MHSAAANLPAFILAAGRGERMRPLSDTVPKPLLPVGGTPMIVRHLQALAAAGVRRVVVNTAWRDECFEPALGDGSRWGVEIRWSHERRDHGRALDSAGGIAKALPLLAAEAFWLVSGDIVCPGFVFDPARARAFAAGDDLACLWLQRNPPFHPSGDFELDADGRVREPAPGGAAGWTFAGIALVRAALLDGVAPDRPSPWRPLLGRAAEAGRLAGIEATGAWHNVGTPAHLAALNAGVGT